MTHLAEAPRRLVRGQFTQADVVIRAGRIYSMSPDREVFRSLAIHGDTIVEVSPDPDGLEYLIGAGTRVIDNRQLTVLPAFCDTHNHLLEATRNRSLVPIDRARSIDDVVQLIRERASRLPAGQWIQTSNGWNEKNLIEHRLPTAAELDEATTAHPVLLRRGGHMAVVNSLALAVSGIDVTTVDPPGGKLGRLSDGTPNGILEGGAQYALLHVPSLPIDEQLASLADTCRTFVAAGIGTVRDPVVSPEGMRLYIEAAERGLLPLRCRPLLLVSPGAPTPAILRTIDGFALRSGFGDDRLRLWGLKFVLDGGPEGGALDAPYANDPTFTGHLNWDVEQLFTVMDSAVRSGFRVATHAIGDRAVRTLLDVYARVAVANPGLEPGTMVIEHAFLADRAQRARAIQLGVAVTVQHALLHALGGSLLRLWGPERTAAVMPVKSWLEEGAQISAGTDYPIGFFEPMRTIWGMITRETADVGVQGPQEAIDVNAAVELSTIAGAVLSRESDRLGQIQAGYLADLVAFDTDLFECMPNALYSLQPSFTLVGGDAVYDPRGMFT